MTVSLPQPTVTDVFLDASFLPLLSLTVVTIRTVRGASVVFSIVARMSMLSPSVVIYVPSLGMHTSFSCRSHTLRYIPQPEYQRELGCSALSTFTATMLSPSFRNLVASMLNDA